MERSSFLSQDETAHKNAKKGKSGQRKDAER